ncbi:MAG: hydroxymethylbilane synthase [Cloacibacterium sp.]|nr:hydroxymethylbilane synthase [Cloacibacterium sp.]
MQIRIGTRNSPLAMWQARKVEQKLNDLGYATLLVPVLSSGDKNLLQPLYSLGITGVFTRDLDVSLLNKEIDIAVHSLKDVPTLLPENIELLSVLERDFPQDILIKKSKAKDKPIAELKVATSSLRRRAFWLNHYPHAEFSDIRGNIQTRLKKLEEGTMDATILSLAGIKRMEMEIDYHDLPFMLPAPSQGVIAIAGHRENEKINQAVRQINHRETQICVDIERSFLRHLEGGCTAPIGAFASKESNIVSFEGRLSSLDGKNQIKINRIFEWNEQENFGANFATYILENGGKEMMQEIKSQQQ